jgi:hypothetical protein
VEWRKFVTGSFPKKDDIMKNQTYAFIALTAFLTASCNKQKAAIDETNNATQNAIEIRKDRVDADAKLATEQIEANAESDKVNVQAEKASMQARLDAEKKMAEAEAEAAKAKVDAEN